MERLLLSLLALLGSLAARAQVCPKRCMCQNLSPSLAILCTKTGLLFVPTVIDRRTVELRLTDNFITVIRRKDFSNMTSLVHLTLSRNTISQILPFAFADLRGLRALHLDNNRLLLIGGDQLKGLPNLRHLILSNNQLHDISPGAFDDFASTLEDLDLSYNNLAQVPWETIRRLNNVNSLNLDHNLIDYVPEGVFTNLLKLARLDMTSNKLKKIPPDPLFLRIPVYAKSKGSPLSSLVLSFGGNPLHCNCELLWLRRLTREDDLETCASPPDLLGKYFWTIPEEEFICETPFITRHTGRLVVTEGEGAVLRCRGVGDPEPTIHWVSREGKVVANTSRTVSYDNGTLEILIATVQDTGNFTCIASNAAGEATTSIELVVHPLPHLSNGTDPKDPEAVGPSDILTSAKAALPASANETGGSQDKGVVVSEVTSSSALIHWYPPWHVPGIRMYQVQYNSSSDDILVYRMIPPSSKAFLVKDLASGRDYHLCVLAVYDDGVTSLTATRSLGCAQFSTLPDALQCHSLHTQFLGGTMIIIIGGIIVASVLVFIIILMIRYKVYSGQDEHKKAKVSNVYSQTNGSQPAATGAAPLSSSSKAGEDKYETLQEAAPKEALLGGGAKGDVPNGQDAALTEVGKSLVRRASDLRTVALLTSEEGKAADGGAAPLAASSSVSLCLLKDPGAGAPLRAKLGGSRSGVFPRELSRTHHHRHSFDGDYSLFQSHSYPRRARTKRHLSTSQLNSDEGALSPRRVTFSSTEWMLESTV